MIDGIKTMYPIVEDGNLSIVVRFNSGASIQYPVNHQEAVQFSEALLSGVSDSMLTTSKLILEIMMLIKQYEGIYELYEPEDDESIRNGISFLIDGTGWYVYGISTTSGLLSVLAAKDFTIDSVCDIQRLPVGALKEIRDRIRILES